MVKYLIISKEFILKLFTGSPVLYSTLIIALTIWFVTIYILKVHPIYSEKVNDFQQNMNETLKKHAKYREESLVKVNKYSKKGVTGYFPVEVIYQIESINKRLDNIEMQLEKLINEKNINS